MSLNGWPDPVRLFPAATPMPRSALLRLALTSGDERLAVLAETGCNRYGVPPSPSPDGIWFASSTASPISRRGYAAASAALDLMVERGTRRRVEDWPETIRRRLQASFGIAGSEVILAGSGTEAELILLALARCLLSRPITNIVTAPAETGSGVILAAEGRHFLNSASCDAEVARGALLSGIAPGSVIAEGVDIRDRRGKGLEADAVDNAVLAQAEGALRAGRDVLVHCLDASKTGLSGFRRTTAGALRGVLGARCVVAVDACQLRCSPEQIRRDLAAGFIVVITGSKFVGGPPFSGAILVPPCVVEQLGDGALPPGLSAYSARHDWPAALLGRLDLRFETDFNLGLYVRWEAALAELDAYTSIDGERRATIVEHFGRLVRTLVKATPGLCLVPSGATPETAGTTIFPVFTRSLDGAVLDAAPLHRGLVEQGLHVGQPVAVGPASALRVCLGAPDIVDVAERTAAGRDLDAAMVPLATRLRALFGCWSVLRNRIVDTTDCEKVRS